MLSPHEPGAWHDPGVRQDTGAWHDPGALHDTDARHEQAGDGAAFPIIYSLPYSFPWTGFA